MASRFRRHPGLSASQAHARIMAKASSIATRLGEIDRGLAALIAEKESLQAEAV